LLFAVQAAFAQERSIVAASTTSTEQSGLFGFLLPRFSAKTGIQVKVVAVGTGQALDSADAAMRTWCSSTTGRQKKNSWPRALVSGVST
jgi:ABC-type tungstate transport system permease subunit